jgi:hypothetical protein
MASFRFIGDPRHGGEGADDIMLLGHRFSREHATVVADARVIAKLAGNSHFVRVDEDAAPESPATAVLPLRPTRKRKPRQGGGYRAAEGGAT